MGTPLPVHRLANWLLASEAQMGHGVRVGIRWCSAHTGLPAVLVAAVGLVVGVRLARRWAHFALEVAVAVGVLFFAARLGWVKW